MATSIGEAVRTTCGDTQMIAEYNLYNKERGGIEFNSGVLWQYNIVLFLFSPSPRWPQGTDESKSWCIPYSTVNSRFF
jgi:hypothetical protein